MKTEVTIKFKKINPETGKELRETIVYVEEGWFTFMRVTNEAYSKDFVGTMLENGYTIESIKINELL